VEGEGENPHRGARPAPGEWGAADRAGVGGTRVGLRRVRGRAGGHACWADGVGRQREDEEDVTALGTLDLETKYPAAERDEYADEAAEDE
jgi:hypothetical protein